MTGALPLGYVTILEAADLLLTVMYAGQPELASVINLREKGIDARDGKATNCAIREIWKAVDRGTLTPLAIGGHPGQVVRLDPALTAGVPVLRSPRGGGFTYLRPMHRAYRVLTAWFGIDLANVMLGFEESEIRKLGQALKRRRRRKLNDTAEKKPSGRPSFQTDVQAVIREVIERKRWHPLDGMKELTRQVNRLGNRPKPVSADTVARAIDSIFEATRDRRFQRSRPAGSGWNAPSSVYAAPIGANLVE